VTLGSCFTLLGYIVGGTVLLLEAQRRRMATEGTGWVVLAGLGGGVIGAKLTLWVLLNWNALVSHPALLLDPSSGGRALIGGIIGGWIGVELAKWRLGIKRSTGDLFALALPAGEAVGRIGCYLNGCCYGRACTLPWAIYQHGAWRHPAQLYSSAVAAIVFAVLLAMRNRLWREGDLFRLYLVLMGVTRFGLEFFRERNLMIAGLSLVQWTCLEIVVLFSVALFISERRSRRTSGLEERSYA